MKITQQQSIELAFRDNYIASQRNENVLVNVKASNAALHEERIVLIKTLATPALIVSTLRVVVSSIPTGTNQLKARKQAYKRSIKVAYEKAVPGQTITFKMDNPVISKSVTNEKTTDLEKVSTLLGSMFGDTDAQPVIVAIKKLITSNQERVEKLRLDFESSLKEEKADSIRAMEKKLAEMKKEQKAA